MRKRTPLIGWLRRDPRHYCFQIPNVVWEYKLKPIEFVILSYLSYRRVHGRSGETITVATVAQAVHITTATAKKYLAALVSEKLITSGCIPVFQCGDSKKFFTLPNEIFLLDLPPSAFMVYAYLLPIEDRRTHTCHPSYNTIVAATGLSKNTVMKVVCALLNTQLITVDATSYVDQRGMKWNGNSSVVPPDRFLAVPPTVRIASPSCWTLVLDLELAAAILSTRSEVSPSDSPKAD